MNTNNKYIGHITAKARDYIIVMNVNEQQILCQLDSDSTVNIDIYK